MSITLRACRLIHQKLPCFPTFLGTSSKIRLQSSCNTVLAFIETLELLLVFILKTSIRKNFSRFLHFLCQKVKGLQQAVRKIICVVQNVATWKRKKNSKSTFLNCNKSILQEIEELIIQRQELMSQRLYKSIFLVHFFGTFV